MSGICDKCKRESCRMKWDGLEYCGFYERGETRYERLFSTPEKAARTLICNAPSTCDECVLIDMCDIGMPATCVVRDRDALLEWLNQEVDE